MRNLFAFFRRFRVFLIFVLLQAFALYSYFSYISYPKSQFLTTANSISGSLLSARNNIVKHFNLEANNKALQLENILLRQRLPESFMKIENKTFKINDTIYEEQYEYIAGEIVNTTLTRKNNYFTINLGSVQGIETKMGVFSDNGIVGRVFYVGEHYALVKSVLSENINVDVIIQPSGIKGLLKWDGSDPNTGFISGISNDFKIKIGSQVITGSGAGVFPKGLPVGKVKEITSVEGKPLWNVHIDFSEDYRKLQNIYVVKNRLQKELEKIEFAIPSEEE
jgi:rod shape-determining protein MreC